MDTQTFITTVAQQLAAWKALGSQTLPDSHPAILSLSSCETMFKALAESGNTPTVTTTERPVYFGGEEIDETGEEGVDYEVPLPDGFVDREAWEAFQLTQEAVLNGRTPDAVVGVINGAEVGNMDAQMEQLRATVEERENGYEAEDEEDGEVYVVEGQPINVDNIFSVEYTRLDGEVLTPEQVNTILKAPISASLKHFGDIERIDMRSFPGEQNRLAVEFLVDSEDLDLLKGMAIGLAQYQGISVFPGIGQVRAQGIVDTNLF